MVTIANVVKRLSEIPIVTRYIKDSGNSSFSRTLEAEKILEKF